MSQLIAMGTPEGTHRLRTEATKACHHLCVGALFERDIQRFSAPRSGVEATLLHFAPLLRMLHLVDVHRPLLLSEAGLLEKLCCLSVFFSTPVGACGLPLFVWIGKWSFLSHFPSSLVSQK